MRLTVRDRHFATSPRALPPELSHDEWQERIDLAKRIDAAVPTALLHLKQHGSVRFIRVVTGIRKPRLALDPYTRRLVFSRRPIKIYEAVHPNRVHFFGLDDTGHLYRRRHLRVKGSQHADIWFEASPLTLTGYSNDVLRTYVLDVLESV